MVVDVNCDLEYPLEHELTRIRGVREYSEYVNVSANHAGTELEFVYMLPVTVNIEGYIFNAPFPPHLASTALFTARRSTPRAFALMFGGVTAQCPRGWVSDRPLHSLPLSVVLSAEVVAKP